MLKILNKMKTRSPSWANPWMLVFPEACLSSATIIPQTPLPHPTQQTRNVPTLWCVLSTHGYRSTPKTSLLLYLNYTSLPASNLSAPQSRLTLPPVMYLKYKSLLLCLKAYWQNKAQISSLDTALPSSRPHLPSHFPYSEPYTLFGHLLLIRCPNMHSGSHLRDHTLGSLFPLPRMPSPLLGCRVHSDTKSQPKSSSLCKAFPSKTNFSFFVLSG